MLKVSVGFPNLAEVEADALEQAGRDVTAAMKYATGALKDNLRGQVLEAGMGRRLANTWRGETYPRGRNSIEPAGYVWTKAPRIIDGFARGATIRPVNGANYLWLPTKNVPRKSRNRKMTPDEVDSLYNAEFVIRPSERRGVFLAFIPVIGAKSGRGFRQATSGRQRQGRKVQLIHMFTLVKNTKLRKLFDLDAAANEAAAIFAAQLEEG